MTGSVLRLVGQRRHRLARQVTAQQFRQHCGPAHPTHSRVEPVHQVGRIGLEAPPLPAVPIPVRFAVPVTAARVSTHAEHDTGGGCHHHVGHVGWTRAQAGRYPAAHQTEDHMPNHSTLPADERDELARTLLRAAHGAGNALDFQRLTNLMWDIRHADATFTATSRTARGYDL